MQRTDLEFLVLCILGLFIILGVMAIAAVASADTLCFDQKYYSQMLVELENGRVDRDEAIPAMNEMILNCEKRAESCEKSVKDCKETIDVAAGHYEKAVEAAKPTFWDRLSDFEDDALIFLGIAGAVILYMSFGK